MEFTPPVVESPQREVMNPLPHDPADDDDGHRRQCELRDNRVQVRAGMKHDQDGTDHARRHVDLKPAARPPMVLT